MLVPVPESPLDPGQRPRAMRPSLPVRLCGLSRGSVTCWGSRPLVYDCSRGRPPESPLLCPSQPITRPGPGPSCFSGGAHVGVRWMENGVEAPGSAGWGAARGRGGASPAAVSPKPASCLMQTRSLAPPARRTPRRTRFPPTSVRRCVALTLRRPQRGLSWAGARLRVSAVAPRPPRPCPRTGCTGRSHTHSWPLPPTSHLGPGGLALGGSLQPPSAPRAWASVCPDSPGPLPLQEIMVGPQFQADLSKLHSNRQGEKRKWPGRWGTGSRRSANPTPLGETPGSSQSQFPGPRNEPEGPGSGPVATSPGQLSLQDTLGSGCPSPLAGPGPCGPPTPRAAALVPLGVWALPTSPMRQSLASSRTRPTCPPETCVYLRSAWPCSSGRSPSWTCSLSVSRSRWHECALRTLRCWVPSCARATPR